LLDFPLLFVISLLNYKGREGKMETEYQNKLMTADLKENKEPNYLLSFDEVIKITGLKRSTIYARIKTGAWPSVRIRNRYFFNREFIEMKIKEGLK